MTQHTKNSTSDRLAAQEWDRLAQENPDHEVDKDAVVAAVQNLLVVDAEQMRHEAAVRAVERVDRQRTTPRNPWKDQLRLPLIPEDEYLVIGGGKRAQRVNAKLRSVMATLRLRWDNVQKVGEEAQAVQAYYTQLMEDLARGMTESEALHAYQQRNGIVTESETTAA